MYRCLNERCNHVFDAMDMECWVTEEGEHVCGCPICGEGFDEFSGDECCDNCEHYCSGYCYKHEKLISKPEDEFCKDYRWEAL